MPLQALAWNWHVAISAHIPLAKTSQMAKPNVIKVERYILPILLPQGHKVGENEELKDNLPQPPLRKSPEPPLFLGENL